jgi:hypothetical protein
VWIHFCGHGCVIRDRSGDEENDINACIVPSDYRRSGVINEDIMNNLLNSFHPNTNIMVFLDCCHLRAICDLPYRYSEKKDSMFRKTIRLIPMIPRIIMISGLKNIQTSADLFHVNKRQVWSGAMTSCLLSVWEHKEPIDMFDLIELIRCELIRKQKGFAQIPMISSNFELNVDNNSSLEFYMKPNDVYFFEEQTACNI